MRVRLGHNLRADEPVVILGIRTGSPATAERLRLYGVVFDPLPKTVTHDITISWKKHDRQSDTDR